MKRLAEGLIDFAIVRNDAVSRPLKTKRLGVMGYSLFVPSASLPVDHRREGIKVLRRLPLATLEGDGEFLTRLRFAAEKAGTKLNIELQCPSFPLIAEAVTTGNLAGLLPSIAATELTAAAKALQFAALRGLSREMCLAVNPRRLRIRPALSKVAAVLERTCQFQESAVSENKAAPAR